LLHFASSELAVIYQNFLAAETAWTEKRPLRRCPIGLSADGGGHHLCGQTSTSSERQCVQYHCFQGCAGAGLAGA
jgi:hypothetical protein